MPLIPDDIADAILTQLESDTDDLSFRRISTNFGDDDYVVTDKLNVIQYQCLANSFKNINRCLNNKPIEYRVHHDHNGRWYFFSDQMASRFSRLVNAYEDKQEQQRKIAEVASCEEIFKDYLKEVM